MVVRRALVVAVCLTMSVLTAPATAADPDAGPEVEPAGAAAAPPAGGAVPSNPPVILNTPDGWTLGLGAKDEMQV
ncbi:MAG: MspA family porin, partial [Mycobacterium sp.]